MKIVVFHAKKYDKDFFTKFKGENELVFVEERLTMELPKDKIISYIKGADAICVFVNCNVNKAVIDILKTNNIKLILTRSAGFNHIDYQYAKENGITTLRVPKYSPYAVAEHAVALLMAINRKTHRAYAKAHLNDFSLDGLLGFDIHSKTIGVLGLGKIGMKFAQIMKGFGTKVIAFSPEYDKKWVQENDIEIVDLTTFFKKSDIISLHCPLVPATKHIIRKENIAKMKKGVVIINTSRGALINTSDLIAGLRSEKISFVGIDVYENEAAFFFEDRGQENINDPEFMQLLQSNKVIVTPHSAFFTNEALTQIAKTTFENVRQFANNLPLENEVK